MEGLVDKEVAVGVCKRLVLVQFKLWRPLNLFMQVFGVVVLLRDSLVVTKILFWFHFFQVLNLNYFKIELLFLVFLINTLFFVSHIFPLFVNPLVSHVVRLHLLVFFRARSQDLALSTEYFWVRVELLGKLLLHFRICVG